MILNSNSSSWNRFFEGVLFYVFMWFLFALRFFIFCVFFCLRFVCFLLLLFCFCFLFCFVLGFSGFLYLLCLGFFGVFWGGGLVIFTSPPPPSIVVFQLIFTVIFNLRNDTMMYCTAFKQTRQC